MNNHKFPRDLSFQQLARLLAFIYATPVLDHQQFIAKWNISRRLLAEICRVDIRTVNSWFSQGSLSAITAGISFMVLNIRRYYSGAVR